MKEELVGRLNEILNPALVHVDNIEAVNHKPHPYMIGPKHLEYNDSMYLGEDEILQMERAHGPMCAVPRCNVLYGQHTYDTVAFVKLRDNMSQKILALELMKVKELCIQEGIDGFAFLETEEKYRVT